MTNAISSPASFDAALLTLKNRNVGAADMRKLEETAKEFEALFIAEMFSHMFSGIEVDPAFGGGQGEEMFRSLLVNEYGKAAAQGGGLGVSDQIKRMMIDMQQQKTTGV